MPVQTLACASSSPRKPTMQTVPDRRNRHKLFSSLTRRNPKLLAAFVFNQENFRKWKVRSQGRSYVWLKHRTCFQYLEMSSAGTVAGEMYVKPHGSNKTVGAITGNSETSNNLRTLPVI